jgi:protein-disulfide isomerase
MMVISVAAVLIGLVAVAALVILSGGLGDSAAAVSEPDFESPPEELRVGRSLGDPDAPVLVEAFEDPQCPACGLFTSRIEPLLIAGPVTNGRVFFTYKDFPFLGQESFDGAVAMRVAEEMDGKFWDFHDVIFFNQQGENQDAFSSERLADMAALVGLDREQFLAEMEDPSYLEAVEAELAEGRARGVNSTPTIFVNGEPLPGGVPTWEDLRAAIDAAAAEARASAAPEPVASEAPDPVASEDPAPAASDGPPASAPPEQDSSAAPVASPVASPVAPASQAPPAA